MKEEVLLNSTIPSATVIATENKEQVLSGRVQFELEKDNDGSWHLIANVRTELGENEGRQLLESEDIIDILQDALSIDQYLQDEAFKRHSESLVGNIVISQYEQGGASCKSLKVTVQSDPYVLQQYSVEENKDLLKILGYYVREKMGRNGVPGHFKIKAPENFIPDEVVLESLVQRIYEGTPAIAILGPTGSGKSCLARYAISHLNKKGFAGYIIDANARLEGDRLFDRDDFNADGTFILEGVLCRIARETKDKRLRLLVVLEEYNSFTDDTRREFYRLFSDEDRSYTIQSSKDGKLLDNVEFSHVQFILTGNPLSSEKYLTDDLKRLSNAEIRRLVILYQGYSTKDEEIRKILEAIVTKKRSFQQLKEVVSDISNYVNWDFGVALFKALNQNKDPLGWDTGYSQVADAIWTAVLRSSRQDAVVIAVTEHILNGIPDVGIRQIAAQRIRQDVNVAIPERIVIRDM